MYNITILSTLKETTVFRKYGKLDITVLKIKYLNCNLILHFLRLLFRKL
jgi:hypothetical protein